MTTISAREFNHDVSAAKRAATREPVIITDRGDPAFVLLSIDEFRRLSEKESSIVDRLRMPGTEDIELDIDDLRTKVAAPRELDL